MKRFSSALAACFLLSQSGVIMAQGVEDNGASATGAVKTVRDMAPPGAGGPDPGSSEAKNAWATQLRTLNAKSKGSPATGQPTQTTTSSGSSDGFGLMGWALLALLAAGGAGLGGYIGQRSRPMPQPVIPTPPPAPTPEPLPPMPAMPTTHIGVLASRAIEEYGHVLVIEVDGQVLALFVDAALGQATLLCRLAGAEELPDDLPWNLERLSARVVTALRAGTPAEAAREAFKMVPRETHRNAEPRAPGQDEDLEILLDELLGKVRGLKPLNKQADEA